LGFFFVFLALSFFCQFEFYRLVKSEASPNKTPGLIIGMLNFMFAVGYMAEFIDLKWMLLNFFSLPMLMIWELYRKKNRPFVNISMTLLGFVYASLPFTMLVFIVFANGKYSASLPMGLLLILWANDTGAFAAGKTMGKKKLFERISPNKTWEGFLGGLVLASIFGYISSLLFTNIRLFDWMVIAIIVSIAGTLGDLVESLFKRSIKIKDSGSIIPGHGGFLDRFDGLLIALPEVVLYMLLF
jgi:phosphatidate cytidylyltransferase